MGVLGKWWLLKNDRSRREVGLFPSWDGARIHAARLDLDHFSIVPVEASYEPEEPLREPPGPSAPGPAREPEPEPEPSPARPEG